MERDWRSITPGEALVDLRGKGTRTISARVEHARLQLPALQSGHNEAWSEKMGGDSPGAGEILGLGDFDVGLAPDGAMAAIRTWLASLGVGLEGAQERAFACRGAPFHHDAESFPDRGFGVLWLADDTPWDLVFPFIDVRVELKYGTVVLFDAAQPHGVVERGRDTFDFDGFWGAALGVFASVDFRLGSNARRALGVKKHSRKGVGCHEILRQGVTSEDLEEETGVWHVRRLARK